MALNSRRHTVPAGTDQSVSRATIFETFGNSIHDVVPVANSTDRAQLVSDLTAAGRTPTTTDPLVVYRADAPGLHRFEWSPDGSAWIPVDGVLRFADKAAATAWATANASMLTAGDEAIIGGVRVPWSGTEWELWPWENITPAAGWTANTGSGTPRIRRDGHIVTYQGGVYGSGAETFVNIPRWARPDRQTAVPVLMDNGSTFGVFTIFTGGAIAASGNVHVRALAQWWVS